MSSIRSFLNNLAVFTMGFLVGVATAVVLLYRWQKLGDETVEKAWKEAQRDRGDGTGLECSGIEVGTSGG